jgi:hypothetical protein
MDGNSDTGDRQADLVILVKKRRPLSLLGQFMNPNSKESCDIFHEFFFWF